MEMKRDNLARIKRMQEYQQKETQRKIAMNDARSEEMKKKKAELLGKSLTLTASALLSLINASVLLTRLSCLITSITTQECT
jgi:predicted transcriptional regulator